MKACRILTSKPHTIFSKSWNNHLSDYRCPSKIPSMQRIDNKYHHERCFFFIGESSPGESGMAFCCIQQHINNADAMWCEQCESLVAGTMINDFKVISYIGSGSLSAVYLAEQQSLNGRKVVIKILQQPWDQLHADLFQREAELLASLSHPYILPIYAFGIIYEQYRSPNISTRFQTSTLFPYLVLPYVEQGS